jgi:hypothetical protein
LAITNFPKIDWQFLPTDHEVVAAVNQIILKSRLCPTLIAVLMQLLTESVSRGLRTSPLMQLKAFVPNQLSGKSPFASRFPYQKLHRNTLPRVK